MIYLNNYIFCYYISEYFLKFYLGTCIYVTNIYKNIFAGKQRFEKLSIIPFPDNNQRN